MNIHLTITNPENGESTLVDLYENESITLNQRFTDIATFQSLGNFTREFRIPFSENNQAFFGPLFNVNYSSSFSFHKKAPAVLSVDTIPIHSGYVQLKKVYTRADLNHDLEIVFYAETPDLFKAIGTKKLSDIDFSDLNHVLNYDNVTAGADEYLYALADRGQKWSGNGEVGSRPVLNIAQPVMLQEMTLCVNAKTIFERIISEAGFQYTANTLNTELSGEWVPFIAAKNTISGVQPAAYFFKAGLTSDLSSFTTNFNAGTNLGSMVEQYDNNSNFASNTWTAPHSGNFTFNIWVTFDPSGNISTESIRVRIMNTADNVTAWTSAVMDAGYGEIKHYEWQNVTIFCEQGDTFRLNIQGSGYDVVMKGNANNDPATGTGWAMVNASDAIAGSTIQVAANAPDMTQADFVRSIVQKMNCAVIPDKNINSKIYFTPLAEYIASGDDVDWTQLIDLSPDKDVVIYPTTDEQKQKLTFTYKAGGDALSKIYTSAGRIYGDYKVTNYVSNEGGEPNDFAQNELSVQLAFESTPCNVVNGTGIVIPKFVNDTGEFSQPGPRILYNSGTAEIALYDEGISGGVLTDVNLICHYSTTNPEIDDFDLNSIRAAVDEISNVKLRSEMRIFCDANFATIDRKNCYGFKSAD